MPTARNAIDSVGIHYEDDGGPGVPVLLFGGFLDSVVDLRESHLARSLPSREFRHIHVDHRGLGQSDRPRGADAYRMETRAYDAVAVLDETLRQAP